MKSKHNIRNICRRFISVLLITGLLLGNWASLPVKAATLGDEYSIANEYIKYTINAKTGGFCIETKEGHPQKSFDNNVPLLYKEDRSRSNGTSFTTVRIDGKDYIFGQQYGWFGINTTLHEPIISEEGRLITVAWDIKGYTVIQKVALSLDENNPLCGNVGISYTVTNHSGNTGNVGIRLLLDNALDANIDAPYVMVNQISPTIVETAYTDNIPQQIRYMDSLSSPDKMSYALLDGWSGQRDVMVDKVIVGHWVNLANSRYNYEPNPSCDFSNYSNEYLVPDTATAYYWSEKPLSQGESRNSEMLYGIGSFAHQTEKQRLSIGLTAEKVELDGTKKAYADDGKFKMTVTLDNSVDGARQLLEPLITLSAGDGLKFAKTGTNEYTVRIEGGINVGSVYDIPNVEIIAEKQGQITSRRIVASVSATEVVDEASQQFVEYSGGINILLPAVGGLLPDVAMNRVNPETVYYEGEKSITVSGNMQALSEALAASDGWSLYLVSSATKESILIEKKNASFIDEGKTMAFSTSQRLAVGKYEIEFQFTDQRLINAFGKKIKASVSLNVSADPKDRCASYGIVSMVRFENPSNHRQTYDFVSFADEEALKAFMKGDTTKNGLAHQNIRFTDSSEILLTIRGKLRQMTDGSGKSFYQAGKTDGDITINSILTYLGDEPLKLTADKDEGATVSGDGTIKVINSINVWHNAWELKGENGTKFTLDQDEVEEKNAEAFELALVGAGSMLQYIGGFLINLKYGVMTEDDGMYGISFGGKITLPIKAPGGEGKDGDAGGKYDDDDEPEDGEIAAAIDDVLYGQKDDGVGFLGINTTLTVKLPEDVMGSMVKNAFGVEAEVTINTIKNYYRIALGLELTMLECEGVIAFKQVPIKSVPTIVPDELFFYLGGDIMQIPIVPPFVFMTGLGGGIADLADTISDEVMGKLPPITINLKTQLLLIETLEGDFELEVKLSGIKFDGELKLKGDDKGDILVMKCGMAVRWISPFYLNAYGDISICSGLLRGGFTIKISDAYFYGYIYAGLFIPDKIPFVGGMQLAGIEAAISSDFIGANVIIIGIKFGFIYYWDGDYKFGGGVDLSSRGAAVTFIPGDYLNNGEGEIPSTVAFGTNLRRLPSIKVAQTRAGAGIIKSFDPKDQDALLLDVPLRGTAKPQAPEIILTNPEGRIITMTENDGKGGGNYLIQTRDDKNYLYITITDPAELIAGNWSLSVTTENVYIDDFDVNGVDYLPELTDISFARSDPSSRDVAVSWTCDAQRDSTADLHVYVTKDRDIMSQLEKGNINDTPSLISIGTVELDRIASGSRTLTLPGTFEEGEFYVVAMLSDHSGGMSKAMSKGSFTFVNALLPKCPDAVSLCYAGNGFVKVDVTGNNINSGNYYMVSLIDEDGEEIQNSFGKYDEDSEIILRPMYQDSNLPVLQEGKTYFAKAVALRETVSSSGDSMYYYSTDFTLSPAFIMPERTPAVLTGITDNLPKVTGEIYTNNPIYEGAYTFDIPVKMTLLVDGVRRPSTDEFKTKWTVREDLEDGIHIVDFEAVNDKGDTVTGSKSGNLTGFTVDTAPPVLTVGQSAAASMEKDARENTVSNQTAFVSEDGGYMIGGLTEKSALLTLEGTTQGITVNPDGTFLILRRTDSEEANQTLLLKAEDLAGNSTELQIYLVNRALSEFESVRLISDLENADEQPEYIEMSIGNSTMLTAKGLSGGKETALDPRDIVWEVLYEHNIIRLSQDGMLEAVAPGETAVKVSYRLSAIEGANGQKIFSELSDVIKIRIRDVGYRYELRQTQGFTLLTLYTDENHGLITVEVNGESVTLLYDKSKKAYVGAFRQRLTGEQLTDNIAFDRTKEAPIILRGDINGDGVVNKADVTAAIGAILSNILKAFHFGESWMRADKNGDGVVDITDVQLSLEEALK